MKQLVVFTFVFTTACFIPPKMRDTGKPANPAAWDAIVANAPKAGYTTERKDEGSHDGKYFWYVKASQGGGTIYYTKNNSTGGVAFTCKGVKDCDRDGLALINGQ